MITTIDRFETSPIEGVTGPGGGSAGQYDGHIPSLVLGVGGLVLLLLGGFSAGWGGPFVGYYLGSLCGYQNGWAFQGRFIPSLVLSPPPNCSLRLSFGVPPSGKGRTMITCGCLRLFKAIP